MAQVPNETLRWLYNVLSNDYTDPQRTYTSTANALSNYPSLSPRTDVYTFETGHSALLLCLSGTLPVNFRNTLYRFPVEIWVPHQFPRDGPMAFVRPGRDMAIRPGQHVGVDGRVYHPYLRSWSGERSNMVEFLRILQDVFAKEPPVMAKQQQQYRQPTEQPAPPPKPSAPLQPVEMPTPDPPPKPRKRGEQVRDGTPAQGHERSFSRTGPPLPPLPHEQVPRYQTPLQGYQNGPVASPRPQSVAGTQQSSSFRNDAPPLPPLPPHAQQQQYHNQRGNPSPVSPLTPDGHAEPLDSRYQHPPPLPPSQLRQETRPIQNPQYHPPPTQPVAYQQQQRPVSIPQPYPAQTYPAQNYPPQQYQHQQAPQSHPQQVQKHPAPAPAPDLLTDPFDISLPVQSSAPAAPPPIPPNPQKEHLLSALSSTLVSQAHAQLQQNASALAPLRAQHAALQAAHSRLNAELSQLQSLSAALETNERILHRSLHDCDAVIESSKRTPAPDIDEVLVAPTVVAQQLWNLQAEEAGLREALWCLQRAVGAGRVSGEVFVRLTRSLARELWLKMALARKVARGLGLEMGEERRMGEGLY